MTAMEDDVHLRALHSISGLIIFQQAKYRSFQQNPIPFINNRYNYDASQLAFATLLPALTHGFYIAGRPAATRTSTSLAYRRPMYPILRRSDMFFPDVDRMFEEMDEMMESSLARFPRPTGEFKLNHRLGFDVTQDEKEYKVAVNVPTDVEVKDIDLLLDHDGRVLRLKGDRTHEEGGMKVHSSFEKAILLAPDVDTTKLAADISGDTLTVVAPKIEMKAALEGAENKKIEINVVEPQSALEGGTEDPASNGGVDTSYDDTVPTHHAVENLKDAEVETETHEGFPAKDIGPY